MSHYTWVPYVKLDAIRPPVMRITSISASTRRHRSPNDHTASQMHTNCLSMSLRVGHLSAECVVGWCGPPASVLSGDGSIASPAGRMHPICTYGTQVYAHREAKSDESVTASRHAQFGRSAGIWAAVGARWSANTCPGTALGGGLQRGIAHIGVLKVLEEHKFSVLRGRDQCGALIGAAYCGGLSVAGVGGDCISGALPPHRAMDSVEVWLASNQRMAVFIFTEFSRKRV